MTKDYLKNVILDVIRETSKIPYLNNGGCVHFAYYLSNELSRYGYDYKIYGFFDQTFDTTEKYIEIFNFEGASHIVLYIKDIGYFDGKIILEDPYKFYPHPKMYSISELPKERIDLNEIRNRKRLWNSDYEKSKYNRKIHNTVKSVFKNKLKYSIFKNE